MRLETLLSILVIISFGIPLLIGFAYILAFFGGIGMCIYDWLNPIIKNARDKHRREQEKLRYELERPQREAGWKASEERYRLKKEAEKQAEQDRWNNLTPEERKKENERKEEEKRKEEKKRADYYAMCIAEEKLAARIRRLNKKKD